MGRAAVRIEHAFRRGIAVAFGLLMSCGTAWAGCQGTNTPDSRYILKAGEAYDTQTNLTWKRCSVGQRWTGTGCTGAIKYLEFQQARGHATGKWRVPTRSQLESLFAQGCQTIAINEDVFPGTPLDPYWSRDGRDATLAWYVRFVTGSTDTYGNRSFTAAVRLVKEGK